MDRPRRAKIVATLGPATDGLELDLVRAGLDVARLNFSHGTPPEHARRARAVREAAETLGRAVAIMQDLQGPKIRVGALVGGGPIQLEHGQTLTITTQPDVIGTAERIGSTYAGLTNDVRAGDRVLLDDGRIRLSVLEIRDGEVVDACRGRRPTRRAQGHQPARRQRVRTGDHRQGSRRSGLRACTSSVSTTWPCRSSAPPTRCARRRR